MTFDDVTSPEMHVAEVTGKSTPEFSSKNYYDTFLSVANEYTDKQMTI